MIISALIPSRCRVEKLRRCLQSIRDTSSSDNVEIIVRIDNDDAESVSIADELLQKFGALVMIGPRGNGWADNNKMFDEMISVQRGQWCWFMNDDAIIEGQGWDELLAKVPMTGFLVHPEIYGLCANRYPNCGGGPFPIAPKNCWLEYGWKSVEHPVDTGLDQLLVHQHGWQNYFLPGISFLHDRDEQDIMRQRKL